MVAKYEVTPFVTHRGGASEFNSLDKAAKALEDFVNEMRANGHTVITIVATQTEHYDPPQTTFEDGFLILSDYDPEA